MFALGISLRMSLRLLYGVRGPQIDDPIHQVMSVTATVFTIAPVVVILFITTLGFGIFLSFLLAAAGLELILARRAMQRHAVWGLISGEYIGRQTSSTFLRQHQNRFTGIVGRAYRNLLTILEQGTDFSTAISKCRSALPADAQAYAAINAISCQREGVADEDDQETRSKKNLIASQWSFVETQLANSLKQLTQRLAYLGSVLLIMIGILVFIMAKIVPSYVLIFEDFDLDLPAITVYLIAASNFVADSSFSVLIALFFIVSIFGAFIAAVCYLCDIPILQPFADKIFFSRHRASVLRLLALSVEAGQPFAITFNQLSGERPHYPSLLVRNRIAKARRCLSEGHDWKDALRRSSFIRRSDLPLLKTAQEVGNLPWVLRTIANQKMRTMVFRWTAIEQITFPSIVLLIGIMILWVCVALFIPLVHMINGLAG